MRTVSRIMGAFTGAYLFKSYVISAVIGFIIFKGDVYSQTSQQIYVIVCVLLFPLASIVWDEIISALTNGTTFVLYGWGILILWAWKIMKCILLFILTPLIAPIGIIYLSFRTRSYTEK